MDPVHVLPDEIIEQIWNMLPLSDLLSCRAVSQTWRQALSRYSNVWRQYCCTDQLGNSCSWYDLFLSERKMKWPWMNASFTDALEIDNVEFYDCTNDHIYVVDRQLTLIKYDSSGRLISKADLQNPCVKLYVINNDVMVMSIREIHYQVDFFNEDLVWIKRITFRLRGNILDRQGLKWNIYYFKDGQSLVDMDMAIKPLKDGWCMKTYDRVFIKNGESTKLLYSSPLTPMSNVFLVMFTDKKDTVVIIDEKTERAGKPTHSTVLICRDGVKLHRVDIPEPVMLRCFSGRYLVLGCNRLYTVHLKTGKVATTRELETFLGSQSPVRIYDILNHPYISLVLVDCKDWCCVFDADKRTILSRITCPFRKFPMHLTHISICKPTMIVYLNAKTDGLVVRKPIF